MGKSSPSPPPAPDPSKVARAQGAANVETAIANTYLGNANETSPYGTVTYNKTGNETVGGHNVPIFERTVSLDPAEQQLLDQQRGIKSQLNTAASDQIGRVSSTLSQPINSGNLPGAVNDIGPNPTFDRIGGGPSLVDSYAPEDGFSADRQRVEDALMQRLNPQLEREREAMDARLVNSGLARDSEIYRRQHDNYGRQANDARLAAVMGAGQEQSRMLGDARNAAAFTNQARQQGYANQIGATQYNNTMGQQEFGNRQTAATFANTARERALQEQLALRNQPINEISALMSGGQVTMPQFTQYRPGNVNPTDVAGPIYQSAQMNANNWQTQMQNQQATMGGLYGLGGTALAGGLKYGLPLISDARLKRDAAVIGSFAGLPLYAYRYLWSDAPHIGVMAQDVARVKPEAVSEIGNGFLAVNYAKLREAA